MKLHTRDQSKEGQQAAQTPVVKWEPGREDYLQFLVDSRRARQLSLSTAHARCSRCAQLAQARVPLPRGDRR